MVAHRKKVKKNLKKIFFNKKPFPQKFILKIVSMGQHRKDMTKNLKMKSNFWIKSFPQKFIL